MLWVSLWTFFVAVNEGAKANYLLIEGSVNLSVTAWCIEQVQVQKKKVK
jgi:hypothetical protein